MLVLECLKYSVGRELDWQIRCGNRRWPQWPDRRRLSCQGWGRSNCVGEAPKLRWSCCFSAGTLTVSMPNSRYSLLGQLLPKQIIRRSRIEYLVGSKALLLLHPNPRTDQGGSWLIIKIRGQLSASFENLSAAEDHSSWQRFYGETKELAGKLWPSVLKPLKKNELMRQLGNQTFGISSSEQPVGRGNIEKVFQRLGPGSCLHRHALIGTFSPNLDQTLNANRCFLYHVIGGGTGAWNVPIGGMGAVSKELELAAIRNGAKLISSAETVVSTPQRRGNCPLQVPGSGA